jgi:hypothetical protein
MLRQERHYLGGAERERQGFAVEDGFGYTEEIELEIGRL